MTRHAPGNNHLRLFPIYPESTKCQLLSPVVRFFKENFDIRSISNEMKKLFNQNSNDKVLSDSFNKMRYMHPLRNDYDSVDFYKNYN